jgi:hypothetical protein
MENFLSKPAQKELRTKFETALQDVWKRRDGSVDEKMVKFCLSDAAVVVPLSNNRMTIIAKPRIEKEFCFGWSSCGQGPSHNECVNACEDANDNLAEYFKQQNLESFDRHYKNYIEANDNGHSQELNATGKYISQSGNNPLRSINFNNREYPQLDKDSENITSEDLTNFVTAINFVREDFSKRIETYLKKYGTKKLRTWTYWIDA